MEKLESGPWKQGGQSTGDRLVGGGKCCGINGHDGPSVQPNTGRAAWGGQRAGRRLRETKARLLIKMDGTKNIFELRDVFVGKGIIRKVIEIKITKS